MYKLDKQLRFKDFVFPYGTLDKENEWVRLAGIIPWDRIEEMYAKKFVNGYPAHPARMALGSLRIKQMLRCSDERTVRYISENPYMQYFIGLKEYTSRCPFGESTMVAFRKRFTEERMVWRRGRKSRTMTNRRNRGGVGKQGNAHATGRDLHAGGHHISTGFEPAQSGARKNRITH